MKHAEKWYQRRLAKYFEDHYKEYEDYVEWFTDPDINQWLFVILKLHLRIELTCNDNGLVTEQKWEMTNHG